MMKHPSKRGFIFFSVMLLALTVIILIIPSVNWAMNESGWTNHSFELLKALNLADAGAELAVWEIVHNSSRFDGWTGPNPWVITLSPFRSNSGEVAGDVSVSCDNYQPSEYLITSTGYIPAGSDPRAEKTVKVLVFPHPLFNNGLFGYNSVTMRGSSTIDSYDSDAGPYSFLTAGSKADVGTNGTLTLDPGVDVRGDVFVNENGEWFGVLDTNVEGELYITGEEVEAVPIPDASDLISLPSQGNLLVEGKTNYVLPSGDYRFESITVKGQATLTLSANTRIYVHNDFQVSGKAAVYTDHDTEIYFGGNVSVAGGGIVNTTGTPCNLELYGVGGASQTFEYSGTSDFYGALFAPNASVELSGTADFFGSIIALDIDIGGTNSFHYDESLQRSGPTEGYEIVYWQEN